MVELLTRGAGAVACAAVVYLARQLRLYRQSAGPQARIMKLAQQASDPLSAIDAKDAILRLREIEGKPNDASGE